MAKLILLVLVVVLVYWLLRSYRRGVERRNAPPPSAGGGEDMVRCERCGVHLPRSESIAAQGRFFCSSEHQRLHQSERHPG